MKQIKSIKFLISLLLCSFATYGQEPIKLIKLNLSKLPQEIKYEGKIKTAVKWTDKQGDHIVVTTETGAYQNKKFKHVEDGFDAEIFAYHYLRTQNTFKQTWKVYDLIQDCSLDMNANFIKDTFRVTDLNHDGIAEVWLMYKTACRGDVSPSNMKIIMYQGAQKYAMRGQNKVIASKDEGYYGGDYKFDEAFMKGNAVFRTFANKLWVDNSIEKWGEQ